MYPSPLLQLCDAIRAHVGNFFCCYQHLCPFIGVYFVYSIACKCGAILAGFYIHALHAPSHPCVLNITFLRYTQKYTRANTKEEQPQRHWLLLGKKPRGGGGVILTSEGGGGSNKGGGQRQGGGVRNCFNKTNKKKTLVNPFLICDLWCLQPSTQTNC